MLGDYLLSLVIQPLVFRGARSTIRPLIRRSNVVFSRFPLMVHQFRTNDFISFKLVIKFERQLVARVVRVQIKTNKP